MAARRRSLDEVQKRGAWRCQASVAKYAKPARLNQQVQALSVSVRGDLENRLETLKTALPKALCVLRRAGGARAPPQAGL